MGLGRLAQQRGGLQVSQASRLNPNSQPSILNPQPSGLNLQPSSLDPRKTGGPWEDEPQLTLVFSMWPLLVRDGQALQYVTVTLLWNYVIGYSPLAVEGVLLRTLGLVRRTLLPLASLAPRPCSFVRPNTEPSSDSPIARLRRHRHHTHARLLADRSTPPCPIPRSIRRTQRASLVRRIWRGVVMGHEEVGRRSLGDGRAIGNEVDRQDGGMNQSAKRMGVLCMQNGWRKQITQLMYNTCTRYE
jgi:hypothetical protein